jgi:hypothetical protein
MGLTAEHGEQSKQIKLVGKNGKDLVCCFHNKNL